MDNEHRKDQTLHDPLSRQTFGSPLQGYSPLHGEKFCLVPQ